MCARESKTNTQTLTITVTSHLIQFVDGKKTAKQKPSQKLTQHKHFYLYAMQSMKSFVYLKH